MGFRKIFRFLVLILLFSFSPTVYSLAFGTIKTPEACQTCTYSNESCNTNNTSTPIGLRTLIFVGFIGLATTYLWVQNKRKLYLIIGVTASIAVGASYFYSLSRNTLPTPCIVENKAVTDSLKPASSDEFKPATDEFTDVSGGNEFQSTDSTNQLSDFAPASSELASVATIPNIVVFDWNLFYQIVVLFILIIVIGLTLKYGIVRKMRSFVLLASVVYLGFLKGGCPCMIMSLQNTILFSLGNTVTWLSMLWFVGLIPLTYFFGKVWCGWLCHLGGLQDFLFKVTGWHWLTTQKSQQILKYIQISLFVILLIQLAITHTNMYVHYDPFKVAFNLISANTTGYILVVLLLLASVLIYRPFCRMACPVGLILGWVSLLPGARKLTIDESSCNGCRSCSRHCKQYVLHGSTSPIKINTQDCILCGECLGHCKKASLSISSKK